MSKYVAWNKQHRRILNGDILHVRRPTGRSWDCVGHADPAPPVPGRDPRGLFLFFNPTASAVNTTAWLPVYYTGAEREKTVGVNWLDGANHTATVDMDYLISVQLQPKAKGFAVATVV